MYYVEIKLKKKDYKKVKGIYEIQHLTDGKYLSIDRKHMGIYNHKGYSWPAEQVLIKHKIPYEAYLGEDHDSPALRRKYDGRNLIEGQVT